MATAKVTSKDVAEYFLACAADENSGITQFKLYNLVYYAQGLALVTLERPLFADKIEARRHGPVPVALWEEYKGLGEEPVPAPKNYDAEDHFNDDELNLVYEIHHVYGRYEAWYLGKITREEDIYERLFAKEENTEYELDEMKKHFSSADDRDVKRVIHNFHYIRELLQSIKDAESGRDKPYKEEEIS